ncbi:MAG: SGNH/GDSL hydrolase family protein [Acidobacteria bacterium]|nr:SGNH/GDSL hydrolase family protein [Acidobacteriota bacterium]
MRSRLTTLSSIATLVCLALGAVAFWQGRWMWMALFVVLAAGAQVIRLPWKRQVAFAIAAILLSSVATVAFVAAVDLYLHARYVRTGGYNIWGYRGPAVRAKQPGERRIVMLGGSVAFGYGVASDETIPANLQPLLQAARPQTPVNVVNLGWQSEGAYSFLFTLKDYDYLKPDAAILYSGYNDWLHNTQVFRHQSAVFRVTGYLPIVPIIPLADWLRIRDLSETRDLNRVVFKPNIADRSSSEAAQTALRITQAVERQLGKLVPEGESAAPIPPGTCGERWDYYCGSIRRAADYALAKNQQVFVVTEPYATRATRGGTAGAVIEGWQFHVEQQRILAEMLAVAYKTEPRLHYINMGRAVDLADPALCYDGVHLTAKGNRQLAEHLAPEIMRAWTW